MVLNKIEQLSIFLDLPKKQQKAVIMLFEGKLSTAEICENVHIGRTTLYNWKMTQRFRDAQDEYSRYILRDVTADAVRTMKDLLGARSEMVRYNAASFIIQRADDQVTDVDDDEIEDDGFEEALSAAADEVWPSEDDGDAQEE